MLLRLSKPIRTVLRWQVLTTAVLMLVSALAAGFHGALSALLGGLVSLVSGMVAAVLATRRNPTSAAGVLIAALSAEGGRLAMMVILLSAVLAGYRDAVTIALLGTFVVTALVFSMAFFVRDNE